VKYQKGYLPEDSAYPFTGLNTLDPPSRIPLEGATRADNMMATKGVISKRLGYNPLGNQIKDVGAAAITNPIVGFKELQTLTGTRYLVMITTRNQFRYDASSSVWVDITKRREARAIDAVDIVANFFEVLGDRLSEFPAGNIFHVTGSTGKDGMYKVLSSSHEAGVTKIFVTDITDDTADGSISADVEWTGDENNEVDFAVGTDETLAKKLLFVTNGKDKPRYWDGSDQMVDVALSGFTTPGGTDTFVTCRTLEVYFDHLIMGGMQYTTGGKHYQDVAWSNTRKLQDFTSGPGFDGGTNVLTDSDGDILRIEPFSDRLVIYTESDIVLVTFIGGTPVFAFERVLQTMKLLSAKSLVNIGPFHLFASNENFFLFDGTKLIRPIGDAIHKTYRNKVSLADYGQASAFHDTARQTVYWVVPISPLASKVFVLEYDVYDVANVRWTIHDYGTRPTVFGSWTRDSSISWDSPSIASEKWNTIRGTWDQGSLKSNFPTRVMGDALGNIFLADDLHLNDNGEAIDGIYETPDFHLPREYQSQLGRWFELEYEAAGNTVEVSYSTDQGKTFSDPETKTLDTPFLWYRSFFDVTSPLLRIRFQDRTVGGAFSLRWMRIWYRAQGVPT